MYAMHQVIAVAVTLTHMKQGYQGQSLIKRQYL